MLQFPIMIFFVLSTLTGAINGYRRSVPTDDYKPVRFSHVPPLLIGFISIPGSLFYLYWRARTIDALPVDLTFLPIALACLATSAILWKWDPVAKRAKQATAKMKSRSMASKARM